MEFQTQTSRLIYCTDNNAFEQQRPQTYPIIPELTVKMER